MRIRSFVVTYPQYCSVDIRLRLPFAQEPLENAQQQRNRFLIDYAKAFVSRHFGKISFVMQFKIFVKSLKIQHVTSIKQQNYRYNLRYFQSWNSGRFAHFFVIFNKIVAHLFFIFFSKIVYETKKCDIFKHRLPFANPQNDNRFFLDFWAFFLVR